MILNERGNILILDPTNKIFNMIYEFSKGKYEVIHIRDLGELDFAIRDNNGDISLFIIWDELPNYDAVSLVSAYKDEEWFNQGLNIMVSNQYNESREEAANALGTLEYIVYNPDNERSKKDFANRILHEVSLVQKIVALKNNAVIDGLTGFYNHDVASKIVSKLLKRYPKQEFAFAIIDLDFFKQVNDLRGHEFGDQILRGESLRLRNLLTSEKSVAIRYGGDEFIVMLPIFNKVDETAQQLFEAIRWVEDDYQITNSVGIATTLNCERDWNSLFRKADQSLFIAKAQGRNQYHVFDNHDFDGFSGQINDLRNEKLNIDTSSLIHALVNGYCGVYQMDLVKIAVTSLTKLADGSYGWSDGIDYLAFINRIIEMCEPESRVRFSEFVNPNTIAGRLKNESFISFAFKGVDDNMYVAKYMPGDKHPRGKIMNALLLIKISDEDDQEVLESMNKVSDIDMCISKSYANNYNAIWMIHPKTLDRELISSQTDVIRHRRINALFEGGNYWEETLAYIELYVLDKDKERLIENLNPTTLFAKIPLQGPYIVYFERMTEGVTYLCEYNYVWSKYRDEDVVLQMYRRIKKID